LWKWHQKGWVPEDALAPKENDDGGRAAGIPPAYDDDVTPKEKAAPDDVDSDSLDCAAGAG